VAGPVKASLAGTAVVVVLVARVVVARRAGYKIGGTTVVRCSKGHIFMTTWVPRGHSRRSRLGLVRFRYCPVGHRWALVTPINEADLTDEAKRLAAENRDTRLPWPIGEKRLSGNTGGPAISWRPGP
jgi:hypothetical protein